jgi:hypothetical protein
MNSPAYGDEAASLLDYAFSDSKWGPTKSGASPTTEHRSRVAMLRADLASDGSPTTIAQAGQLVALISRQPVAR